MKDLEQKLAANAAAQSKVSGRLADLSEQIAATDWLFLTIERGRNGETREQAESRRSALNAEKRQLDLQCSRLDEEARKLHRQLAEQKERADRERWSNMSRGDLLAACRRTGQAVATADAATREAQAESDRQLARLAECDAAELAVTAAHAALVDAQGQFWLQRTAAAEAAERDAAATMKAAEETARRAVAARPHIEAEVNRAREMLAMTEGAAEQARAADKAQRLTLARFDWNEAVSKLAPAFSALSELDRGEAMRLHRAMADGLVVFNHRGRTERPAWFRDFKETRHV